MTVVSHLITDRTGGWGEAPVVTTDSDDVVVGPVVTRPADSSIDDPRPNGVLSVVLYVRPDAQPGSHTLFVDGEPVPAYGPGIDNQFSVVSPIAQPAPNGGGVITLTPAMRSPGGTVVFESLDVAAGQVLRFSTEDGAPNVPGNSAYLPAIVLVRGAGGHRRPHRPRGHAGGRTAAP
jgi:hypothetical protein